MRRLRPLALLFALIALPAFTAPALAGGVAVVVPDDDGGVGVTAGDDATISFTLLQHGVSPVEFGTTAVVVTDLQSGESFRITATPVSGSAGRFAASFVYPRAGWWTWHVEHTDLLVQSAPEVVGIFGSDGETPGFYRDGGVTTPSERIAEQLATVTAQRDRLTDQLAAATSAAAANAQQAAATEGRVPLAVTMIGVAAAALAGLGIGFGITRSGSRPPRRGPAVREIAMATPADAD